MDWAEERERRKRRIQKWKESNGERGNGIAGISRPAVLEIPSSLGKITPSCHLLNIEENADPLSQEARGTLHQPIKTRHVFK